MICVVQGREAIQGGTRGGNALRYIQGEGNAMRYKRGGDAIRYEGS